MEKGTFSFTHEELKQTADVLRDNADWLEEQFKDKPEPLNLSIICIVCNEDTGEVRTTTIGKASDLASTLAHADDSVGWGRVLIAAAMRLQIGGGSDEE